MLDVHYGRNVVNLAQSCPVGFHACSIPYHIFAASQDRSHSCLTQPQSRHPRWCFKHPQHRIITCFSCHCTISSWDDAANNERKCASRKHGRIETSQGV